MSTASEAKVRLYDTLGGRYIDLSNRITDCTIKDVENYGQTGNISFVNDLSSASGNFLNASCNRWSSGTGAIRTGMFLYIYNGSISTANQLGIFIITNLSASDDTISLTFGDALQILRATGADYYRNHYSAAQQHNDENAVGGWDSSAEMLYVTKPSDVTLDAANGDVKWAVNRRLDTASESSVGKSMRYKSDVGTGTFTFTLDQDWIFSFTIYRLGSLKCRVRMIVGGVTVANKTFDENSYSSTDQERTITLSSPAYVRGKTITVVFDNISVTYGAYVKLTNHTGATWDYYQLFISGDEYEDGSIDNALFVSQFNGAYYEYANAGEVDEDDSTRYYITGIDNVSSIDSSMGSPSFSGRAKITYLITAGGLSMSTIFQRICSAAGFSASTISSNRSVGIFRCGGDFYHNYLLALADMDEPSGYTGRQHGIACSKTSWGTIYMGYRYKASDSSVATLYYAGDGSPGSGAIVMKSFSPSITMKYRPFMAVTKGTKDDGTPIIIAMRDPDVSIGSAVSVVDGSITTIEDAALSSYSEIITNRSKDWEGQIVLSGIYFQFMLNAGTYIGGVPIRIYDSRYGMSNYQARVKEVKIDFTNQKTTLTLNNYSEMYANSLIDSSKMAYNAGNLAVEASSSDLFTKQYVALYTTSSVSSSASHTIEIYSAETGYVSAVADILKVTDLGICVLSAYFKRGVATVAAQYGITRVRVDGSTVINIDSYRRPDKYSNQSLIVNVQMSL